MARNFRWFHKEVLKLWRHCPHGYKSVKMIEGDILEKGMDAIGEKNAFYVVDQMSGVRSLQENPKNYARIVLERPLVVSGENHYRPNDAGRLWLARREWLFRLEDMKHARFGRRYPLTMGTRWL